MFRSLAAGLATLVVFASILRADEKPALEPGNYIVYYAFTYTAPEQALCLLKIEKKGGDLKGSIVETAPRTPLTLAKLKVDGRNVDIAFDLGGRALTFEGRVSPTNAKLAVGSFGDDRLLSRAKLVATDKDTLEKDDLVQKIEIPEAFNKAEPAALKEIIAKNAGSPLALEAVLRLLRVAEKSAKPAEAAAWIKEAEAYAEAHGPRFLMDVLMKYAEALKAQKGFSALTAATVEKARKLMTEPSLALQSRLEKILLTAYQTDGKTDLAKLVEAKVANLELALDKEYLAKVPPFKSPPFEGRKSKSDRVVVMELFTGAQCPPCVAADVAFDVLEKSYKPTDLVLLQYHMHIPGPDPLTNSDSEARWKYYQDKFDRKIGGTPTTLFNGKPEAGGGGGMSNSEGKFKQFKGIIDPMLEEESPVKINGHVTRTGDKLGIKVEVSGLKESKDDVKLRFVLVEETIKYVGGNGLRFHHHVVRAFPGGVEGTALTDKTNVKTVEVDLAEVRKNLTMYLDNYSKERPFFSPDRPLDLKHLHVVALVQDDASREILQSLQLETPSGK